ncbi:hypothetical protein BDV98DRAFT_568144 [Pterulicium gracile]|uniref:Uncharacterized protein n=1 Tax=Pterulicium gracile TaxID=1884261 RepID=A0A5C3QIY1_9AGAR|nr:hypothetical protein BDV98DRAFT_568144 [Pterula gracilis]
MKREIGHQFELMLKLFSDTAFEAGVLVRRVAQDEDEWPFEAMPDASEHEPSTKFDDYKRECFAGRGPVPYLNGDLTQVSADGVYEGGEGSGEWSETLRLVMLCLMDLEWHKISLEDSMKVKQKRAIKEQVELLLKDNLNAVEECRVLLRRLAEHEDVWPINLRAQ